MILYLCLILISCRSGSKESYLLRYERFVRNIQTNHATFDERDWLRADRQITHFNNVFTRRFSDSFTTEERNRIINATNIYNSMRYGNVIVDNARRITENVNTVSIDNNRSVEELRRITENQEQIALQLEQLRRQILEEQNQSRQITPQQRTEQEILIDRLQNDLLMEILAGIRQGRFDIYGRIKMLVFPTNFNRNPFRMNHNALTPIIQDAVNIVLSQARRYNVNLSIYWEFRTFHNGSHISISDSIEGLRLHSRYRNIYNDYDFLVSVFAVDMIGRSFIRIGGPLGKSETNAIIWFRDNNNRHSSGVLAHEIFHAFGAEDLYFEQGVVPQEVELYFRTLLGDSIMITSCSSANLDPINSWLIGWNQHPEPWFAWFINRRDHTVDLGLR